MNFYFKLFHTAACVVLLIAAVEGTASVARAAGAGVEEGVTLNPPPLTLGVDKRFLGDVDPKDALTAVKLWASEIPFSKDYRLEAKLLGSTKEIIQGFQNGGIVMANASSLTYLKIKRRVDVQCLFTEVIGGKRTRKYMLLVRGDSPHATLNQLENCSLSLKTGDDISRLFIDTKLLERGLPTTESFFSEIHWKRKYSQVINSVFFRQADACLVPDYFLSVMSELNPQIDRQLKILSASEGIVDRVTFVKSNLDERLKKLIVQNALSLKDYARGRQILLLFKTDGLECMSDSEIEPLNRILETYEKLSHGMGARP